MTIADILLGVLLLGLTLYTLFAGADFGAGIWDLLSGGTRRGAGRRKLIEHSIAPVWEANHVWLILVITLFWTAFPPAFAAFASTLYIPLTLAAFGIIGRGAAFAFRKASHTLAQQRLYGATFALSSLATPFFLGAIVGALASGRVPPGIAQGDIWGSWLNPTSIYSGLLAIGVCAYLAAVYLLHDARRAGAPELVAQFRRRALVTGVLVGAGALAGLAVVAVDAPDLFADLGGRALPLVLLSLAAGIGSLVLIAAGRYRLVRVTAALAVAAVLWAWGAAQYPVLLSPGLDVAHAAGDPTVLATVLVVLVIGALLLVPSLLWLFGIFQRAEPPRGRPTGATPDHLQR
ncbi:cytochrome bd-I ubiquinol oxidase subunit 2 apoprotein [Micromonospora rhizosphaerae]|uniref:Cytochrome bd-I ubiquinol oxidase subunit 2 apoprotein n=1 Tax=Micromonospora rhizosphaerae TaxID=568872 RepID=A0A1C6SUH1_9ACTN|nr:cytochrome d ubiquinol oxidase subunit II [Micromonospora rhizosphaerae]SCL32992.1 cytochrome bd-I ubiquinol oxidase subunit 2 apoprotein [Micromonospora rhizosphaerae]